MLLIGAELELPFTHLEGDPPWPVRLALHGRNLKGTGGHEQEKADDESNGDYRTPHGCTSRNEVKTDC
jgi:hypothetical protein